MHEPLDDPRSANGVSGEAIVEGNDREEHSELTAWEAGVLRALGDISSNLAELTSLLKESGSPQ